jgi:hypothetical protein
VQITSVQQYEHAATAGCSVARHAPAHAANGHSIVSGYIHVDKDLPDDPRVLALTEVYVAALVRELASVGAQAVDNQAVRNVLRAVARNASMGALLALWMYADTHVRENNSLGITLDRLADVCRTSVDWLQQMPPEWLRVDEPGRTTLPDYIEKNCLTAREVRREKGRLRSKRFRERHKASGAESHDAFGDDRSSRNVTLKSNARNADSRAGAHAYARGRPHSPSPGSKTPLPPEGVRGPLTRKSRTVRDASLRIWTALLRVVDEIQHSTAGLTWAHVEKQLGDRNAYLIAESIGFRLLAERTRYTQGEYKRRFREAFEQLLDRAESEKTASIDPGRITTEGRR